MRAQLIFPLIKSLCEELGIGFIEEPSRGMYAALCFRNGRKFYIKDVNFNINSCAPSGVAKNKAAGSFFLAAHGYHVPEFTLVYHKARSQNILPQSTVEDGLQFARDIGFPVVLKPNNLSQGRMVFVAGNAEEYRFYAGEIAKASNSFQVQRYYAGKDYRVVVLGGEVISAYQRVAFHVVGDGVSPILALMRDKQQVFIGQGRDTVIDEADIRTLYKLKRQNLTLADVPAKGQTVFLQDVSNLSAGGETVELTEAIHPTFKALCARIAGDMALELCGIDIIAPDLTAERSDYVIIEINSAPGLDNYAYTGAQQQAYVRALYRRVLLHVQHMMEREG